MSKQQVGRCVHCLKDNVVLTSDHMFPKAWYPDATPENLEKWQFPACNECNNRYSKIERDLLGQIRDFARHQASSFRRTRRCCVERNLIPMPGTTRKTMLPAKPRLKKVLAEMCEGEEIPDDPESSRDLANDGDVLRQSKSESKSPAPAWMRWTKKIVRGLAYREDGQFVEPPYEIAAFVDNEGAAFAKEMVEKAGKEFEREPGLVVRRATVEGDHRTAIYEITFWQQFKTYATVQKTGVPPDYYILNRREAVTSR